MKISLIPYKLTRASVNPGETIIPVSLISLPDQEPRRLLLLRRGIPLSWVENYFQGVDFRALPVANLNEYADIINLEKINKRKVRPGEIGCALAHHSATQSLMQTPFDLMLVLEDDVIPLSDHFEEQILTLTQRLMPLALRGVAFICHLGAPHQQADHALKRLVINRGRVRTPSQPILYLHSDPDKTLWRAHAYLISRAAIRRAQQIEPKIMTLADDWCERRRMGILDYIFYSRPVVFRQDETIDSTIRPKDHNDGYQPSQLSGTFISRLFASLYDGTIINRAHSSLAFRILMAKSKFISHFPFFIRS